MTTTSRTQTSDVLDALGVDDIDNHDFPAVWRSNAYTDEIKVPYGYRRDGDEILPEIAHLNFYDMNRGGDGPHGAVAGVTGSGLSHFLRVVALGLVSRYGPDKVALVLAAAHSGAVFRGMDDLPHAVATVSDLENSPERADALVSALQNEADRRMRLISGDKQLPDIFSYRAEQQRLAGDPGWPPLPDLIVIIEECGPLLFRNSQLRDRLLYIARIGRALGMHVVLASQLVTRVGADGEPLFGDLIDAMSFRFSLRTPAASGSRDLIGTGAAAEITTGPGSLRGAMLQKLPDDSTPVEVVAFPIHTIDEPLLAALSRYGDFRVMDRWEI